MMHEFSPTLQFLKWEMREILGVRISPVFVCNPAYPLVLISVDGVPDEAPKNQPTLAMWTRQFQNHNLDAVFVFTHVPSSSAYNPVERRMAPLSKDTAGVMLPFDTFGCHLDGGNETIDFEATGKILTEVWSESNIDSYPIVPSYTFVHLRQSMKKFSFINWKSGKRSM